MSRHAVAVVVLGLAACSSPSDPEQELRDFVAAAERAAEARDTGFFRGAIAAGYRDERGNDRDQLINSLRGYFLIHSGIEVVSRVAEIELAGSDAARVVVQAGVVGRRAGGRLLDLSGELHELELELVRDGSDWRVIGARWERARGQ